MPETMHLHRETLTAEAEAEIERRTQEAADNARRVGVYPGAGPDIGEDYDERPIVGSGPVLWLVIGCALVLGVPLLWHVVARLLALIR